jgi:precorrin-6A/cobalt-precorrin-6A reductase
MILLLGGTSSTSPLTLRLAQAGYQVLVSKATAIPLEIPAHGAVESRSGPLDELGLTRLIADRGIRAIVDATHPYAGVIRATARRVAQSCGIPYLSLTRAATITHRSDGVELAADHPSAALAAFSHQRPVLLTTGSKNLAPYVAEARRSGLALIVRVLDHADSIEACHRAGIAAARMILGRGPYSVADNRRQIRQFGIGVLVAKDSGAAGGTAEKLEAARAEGCQVIVVQRPRSADPSEDENSFTEIDALVEALDESMKAEGGTGKREG